MSRDPIIGSGRKGFGFEQKGFQERNLQLLLETLSKKETQKSIEALSKIDKDEWKIMSEAATSLNKFIELGGTVALFSTVRESIKETITLQIDDLLSPLQNEINQAITDQLTPFLNDILTPVINSLNSFLSNNSAGAGVGGIVGSIISFFVPGGQFWVVLGAVIGAFIEELFGGGGGREIFESRFELYAVWVAETGGGTIVEFIEWLRTYEGTQRIFAPSTGAGTGGLNDPLVGGGIQEDF